MRTILVSLESNLVSHEDFMRVVRACQTQITRDFFPLWDSYAILLPIVGKPSHDQECVHIIDTADVADALGYHTVDSKLYPQGFVFVKTAKDSGERWEATLSHELLEQLVDPTCIWTAVVDNWDGTPASLALETADPVENDEYLIDNQHMSNFVTPEWFYSGKLPRGTKFDFMNKLTNNLTLSNGGYQAYTRDLVNWRQTFANRTPAHQMKLQPYSRRSKRIENAEEAKLPK